MLNKKKLVRIAVAQNTSNVIELTKDYNAARIAHRKLERHHRAELSRVRDEKLFQLTSGNPHAFFKSIKASKRETATKIHKLHVGDKVYVDEYVGDGFFDSISNLKYRDLRSLDSSSSFSNYSSEYSSILEVCKDGPPIPNVSETECVRIMQRMKPDVNDVYGITLNHYNNAGLAGVRHFCLLLNTLIKEVNVTTIEEINTVHTCILFKGHNKDRSSDRSYRTISSCPVVAKGLDLYIRDLSIVSWNQDQAPTQFQGEGSSHELAALLLTETIQQSLYSKKQPIFILYLDAMSAFDVVLPELLIRNLFHNCNTGGHVLHYINNRLSNRQTFIDWEGVLMGPINDQRGLEQGGLNSSDFYKIFGKRQLTMAQDSSLGVKFGEFAVGVTETVPNVTVAAIGQADDTALVANNLHDLNCLLQLSLDFCSKYHVSLSPGKTKLQVMYTRDMKNIVDHAVATNPISIDEAKIDFAEVAEHVGLLRASSGNLPAILGRISAHNRALGAVLHAGMARGHRGSPAASIHADRVFGIPVLLSGLASLVLLKSELHLIDQHHKDVLRNLQRLLPATPRSVVYFLAGSLPGEALLHLRQLTIFGMISRLPQCLLHEIAVRAFSSNTPPPARSWFSGILKLCIRYDLDHPRDLLSFPIPKQSFKKIIRKKVLDFWEQRLRDEAEDPRYSSLTFFKPRFMSLTSPHPLWSSAGSSPSRIAMATVQAQMISGRYRSESLCRHWSRNKMGFCLLSNNHQEVLEDVTHILKDCDALHDTRMKLLSYTRSYCQGIPTYIADLILSFLDFTSPNFCQFLLDCSVLPSVIRATQDYDAATIHHHTFMISRTWVYSLHKRRMTLLGRWNFC